MRWRKRVTDTISEDWRRSVTSAVLQLGRKGEFGGYPPRKTLITVAWFLLLGSGVFLVHRGGDGTRASGARDGAATDVFTPPLGGLAGPPIPTATGDIFEVPDKSEAATRKIAKPREPHQPLEDARKSMCPFYKALATLDKSDSLSHKSVRILHYGDSILTTDELSGRVRSQLQKRFGDGGHGFVLLGKPWRWYRHKDVALGARGEWKVRSLTSSPSRDGIWGLGGVTFDTTHHRARSWVGADPDGERGKRVASFDISYLTQPAGGSMDVFIDGELVETISTRQEYRGVTHKVFNVTPGPSKLAVKARGDGKVRVFGAVMESDRPGVVYDALAINGVRASNFLRFDEHHFAEELRHREANLVVMMLGANEGANDSLALGAYRRNLTAVLQRIRRAVPHSGCLVVGPLDQAQRGVDGLLVSKRMPRKLTRLQRKISQDTGCAFFDTFSAMGGDGSMPRWFRRGLVGGDFIHPTEQGAKMVGSWLTEALLAGYENFLFNGEQCESNVTSL